MSRTHKECVHDAGSPGTQCIKSQHFGDRTQYLSHLYSAGFPIGFNEFLIDDEYPTLIHTGYYHSFDAVRSAIAQVVDPKRLAYVVIGHFESDECGGMSRFLQEVNNGVLVASDIGAVVNLRARQKITESVFRPIEGFPRRRS